MNTTSSRRASGRVTPFSLPLAALPAVVAGLVGIASCGTETGNPGVVRTPPSSSRQPLQKAVLDDSESVAFATGAGVSDVLAGVSLTGEEGAGAPAPLALEFAPSDMAAAVAADKVEKSGTGADADASPGIGASASASGSADDGAVPGAGVGAKGQGSGTNAPSQGLENGVVRGGPKVSVAVESLQEAACTPDEGGALRVKRNVTFQHDVSSRAPGSTGARALDVDFTGPKDAVRCDDGNRAVVIDWSKATGLVAKTRYDLDRSTVALRAQTVRVSGTQTTTISSIEALEGGAVRVRQTIEATYVRTQSFRGKGRSKETTLRGNVTTLEPLRVEVDKATATARGWETFTLVSGTTRTVAGGNGSLTLAFDSLTWKASEGCLPVGGSVRGSVATTGGTRVFMVDFSVRPVPEIVFADGAKAPFESGDCLQ